MMCRELGCVGYAIVVCGLVCSSGCTKPNPNYCDNTRPCTDPERPYCDTLGQYPASDGINNVCIPDPFAADAGTDGSTTADAGDAGVGTDSTAICPITGLALQFTVYYLFTEYTPHANDKPILKYLARVEFTTQFYKPTKPNQRTNVCIRFEIMFMQFFCPIFLIHF